MTYCVGQAVNSVIQLLITLMEIIFVCMVSVVLNVALGLRRIMRDPAQAVSLLVAVVYIIYRLGGV